MFVEHCSLNDPLIKLICTGFYWEAQFEYIYHSFDAFSYTKKSLVHHMTLFECTSSSYPGSDPLSWDVWVKSNGAVCNSNLLTPRDWDSCITPIASWAVGSTGT